MIGESGRDDRDADLVLHRRVDDRAEDDVRLVVRRLVHDLRCLVDLVDRQIGAAGEVDEHASRAGDRRVVEQRARDGLLRGVDRAILSAPDTRAHHRHAHARHDRANVGEIQVDEPGDQDEIRDALHRLLQHRVGHAERIAERRAALDGREEPLVRNRDQRVDDVAERLEPGLGLHHAPPAFEVKRLRDDRDRQDPELLRKGGDDGRRAGAGAAAEAGRDEDHVGAGEQLLDLVRILLRGVTPDVRVRAGAESLGERHAELEPHGHRGIAQRLEIRVGDDELDPGGRRLHHAIEGVAAAAAEADDLDLGDLDRAIQLEQGSSDVTVLHEIRLLSVGNPQKISSNTVARRRARRPRRPRGLPSPLRALPAVCRRAPQSASPTTVE